MSSQASRAAEAKHVTQVIELPEMKPHPVPGNLVVDGNLAVIQSVKVRLRASAGEVTMTVGDLMALREDSIVALDRALDEPLDLMLDGHVVARGQLVAVGDEFGIRITEVSKGAQP